MSRTDLHSVLVEERPASDGYTIGIVKLNEPSTLNSLSLAMAEALQRQLDLWALNDRIAVVVILGEGDRAFCAGGDLHALYGAMIAQGRDNVPLENAYVERFFSNEYRLDFTVHTYPKPVLAWANGIVMGGGVGIAAGASHRVVTENTRIAMPEVGVGLFPDVGASWFLPRFPGRVGRFLALTGAPLRSSDAHFVGMADYELSHSSLEAVLDALRMRPWSKSRVENGARLTTLLRSFEAPREPGPLQRYFERLRDVCRAQTLEQFVADAAVLESEADRWLVDALKALSSGAPSSMRLAWETQERAQHASLADSLRMEYVVALHCSSHGDFREGIRALLIDKDRAPRWTPASLEDASTDWIERFFTAPWATPAAHPLADLSNGSRPWHA